MTYTWANEEKLPNYPINPASLKAIKKFPTELMYLKKLFTFANENFWQIYENNQYYLKVKIIMKLEIKYLFFIDILCIFIFIFYVNEQPFINFREKIILCLEGCQKELLLLRSSIVNQSEILYVNNIWITFNSFFFPFLFSNC